jgi:hypothetical protein
MTDTTATPTADPFREIGGDHPFADAGVAWTHAIPAQGGGFVHWDGRTFNSGETAAVAEGSEPAPAVVETSDTVPTQAPTPAEVPAPVPPVAPQETTAAPAPTLAETELADAKAREAADQAEVAALEAYTPVIA